MTFLKEFIYDDFISNHKEIVKELKKPEIDKLFLDRKEGYARFATYDGKGANMFTLMSYDAPQYLKDLALSTAKLNRIQLPDTIAFNKYLPGGYLGKHRDSTGKYWDFNLIFLQSTRSHFTVYDDEDNPHLIEEKPGRCIDMPLHILHESTPLGRDEDIKYSMVFTWGII